MFGSVYTGDLELSSAAFSCCHCYTVIEATVDQYAMSGFWPGNEGQKVPTYFVHTDYLLYWYYNKHETLGTSEENFLEISRHIARSENRICLMISIYI